MIEVVVKNRPMHGPIFFYSPDTVTYVGEVLDNPPHVSNDYITLTSDDFIPYRLIRKDNIVTFGGYKISFDKKPKENETFAITGSRGDKYYVTKDNDKWSCTCVGFGYHGDCRHIRDVKANGNNS